MSELITNLQHIYNIKLELKDVLETDSDLFEEYPDIVAEKIAQGGGGSATPVDPWYNGTNVYDMIVNEEDSADYVYTDLMENFTVTLDQNEEIVEAVEWDFTVNVETGELDGEDNPIMESKTVHVIVSSNDEHGELGTAIDIEAYIEAYPDLEDAQIFPTLENATLTTSEDPSEDGYDYLLEGDIYAWNLNNNVGGVMEITENGFFANSGSIGYEVNVPTGGGLSEGTYNIFNFLQYGWQYGMVELNNKPYEEINLYNLGPVNYIDPMDGMETKYQYAEMTLWDNSQMDTEVEFENVTGDATSTSDDHWYQFNELSQSSDADEFMAVHIDVYDWVSDIDPDTQMDAGSWEVSGTYIAVFENTYGVDGDGAWTYTIRFYYDNNNNEWVVDLYQNGVLFEEGVSAFAQQ